MSEADEVGPSARTQAGLLAHRTRGPRQTGRGRWQTDALNGSPSHLDELPRKYSGSLGRVVANRLRHASIVRFTVAGTAPDSSDFGLTILDWGL